MLARLGKLDQINYGQITEIKNNRKGNSIFNSNVKAILFYASESWTITHRTIYRLQVLSTDAYVGL